MAPLAAHLRTKPAPTEQPGEALSSWLNGFKEHALTPALFQRVFQTLVLRQADKRRNIPVPLYTTATRHETARSRRPITRACIHATPSAIISSTASRTSESIFISISSMSRVWCRKCVKCYLCRYFTLLFHLTSSSSSSLLFLALLHFTRKWSVRGVEKNRSRSH